MSLATLYFKVPDITCISCVRTIEYALKNNQPHEIVSVSADVLTTTVAVVVEDKGESGKTIVSDLQNCMDDVSFSSTLMLELGDEAPSVPKTDNFWRKLRRFFLSHWFQGILGLVAGISLLVLSMVFPALPLGVMIAMGVVSVILTLVLGARSYYHAVHKLIKARTLTMDALFTISTLTVIAVSIAAFFVPWLPMMLEAGLLIFGFRHIGLAIEESLKRKMTLDKKFQQMLPPEVKICHPDEAVETRSLHTVAEGDVLWIRAGDLIPVDGICLSEGAYIHDTIKTGSINERPLAAGEVLISGMRLHKNSMPIRLQATKSAAFSYLARLDQNIVLSNREKAPIQETTARILQYFIPGVMALALITGIVLGILFPPALAIQCAVAILVSACPCTLGLVVPLAVKIGMHKAAAGGVQFKSAKELQAADDIDVVVFDLNGTLTEGAPVVSRFVSINEDMDERSLLAYAVAMERHSKHPVANAVRQYASLQRVQALATENESEQSHHAGLRHQFDEDVWLIGNADMMRAEGVHYETLAASMALQAGESVVYITRNGRVLGYFVLSDQLRPEAQQTIHALKKLGKQVHICTGADEATAIRYADMLGIPPERVASACIGMAEHEGDRGKNTYIQNLKNQGLRVAMIGDADNDSLALSNCDFGIAVASASSSDMTRQQAGAVIQDGSLLPVATAFVVARQTVTNIKRNLFFSLGYNLLALTLAVVLPAVIVGFTFGPGLGVAFMVLQMVVILLIAWRFKKQPLQHLQEKSENQPAASQDSSWHGMSQRLQAVNEPGFDLDNDSDEDYDQPDRLFYRQKREAPELAEPLLLLAADPSDRVSAPQRVTVT